MNRNNDIDSNKSNSSLHSLDSMKDSSSDITIDQKSANSGYSTSSSSLVTSTSSVSVLEPIHVTDARNRSFLVGSVGSNVSVELYNLGRKPIFIMPIFVHLCRPFINIHLLSDLRTHFSDEKNC